MKSALSEKGQISIPKRIRTKLGLRPGAVIEFSTRQGVLIGKKADLTNDPVGSVTGIISLDESVDEYLDMIRGDVK
jgi:AbrB family looped-hinge helix DNA binding protein